MQLNIIKLIFYTKDTDVCPKSEQFQRFFDNTFINCEQF